MCPRGKGVGHGRIGAGRRAGERPARAGRVRRDEGRATAAAPGVRTAGGPPAPRPGPRPSARRRAGRHRRRPVTRLPGYLRHRPGRRVPRAGPAGSPGGPPPFAGRQGAAGGARGAGVTGGPGRDSGPGGPGGPMAVAAWERVREAHARLRALAPRLADPGLRDEVLAVCEQLAEAGPDGPAPPGPAGRITGLAPRELDVLACVAAGATNADAAHRLGVRPETVKAYLRSAMRRLGAHSRLEAVVAARRAGLLP
ncbi:helix-turn-helix transcriptional regulator [Streptomyces sp. PLAI1-29]|uniref:Helix-turn-helix transcriptional regulator n=1 Tax=Streptomyces zingiberis TaxID=2053010 RepID=A0ABX1C5C3_9ACTN|nr:helix-turn-helix transcriptional regulator [Streptomyces zingiberis]